jgi:hypothetical protein
VSAEVNKQENGIMKTARRNNISIQMVIYFAQKPIIKQAVRNFSFSMLDFYAEKLLKNKLLRIIRIKHICSLEVQLNF